MKLSKQFKKAYPHISNLGIPVYFEPINHVLSDDIHRVLGKKNGKIFSKFFGAQTCLRRDDGKTGLYIWDVEAVLVRMVEKKLTGTQHPALWD
jgi:hypothetical protein